jgi:transcriptional regulator with XRE-family HTH domain
VSADAVLEQVGPRLRAARVGRGLTLEELSELAGMSSSTLSRLESGKRQATLELLLPLTRQLGLRLDDLVPAETPDPRVRQPAFELHGRRIVPLTPEGSPVHTFKITFPPGSPLPEPQVHDGYDWLFVLSGRLSLRLGDQVFTLTRGEAAEFDTRTPHSMAATGSRGAEVLSVFSDVGARIHTQAPPA